MPGSSPAAGGRDAELDRRCHPFRADLAASRYQGQVAAERYVDGEAAHVTATRAPVHPRPDPSADLDTEALFGESVTIYERAGGWAWVQLDRDGYVGYLPETALTAGPAPAATHRVAALAAYAYERANARSRPVRALSFGAAVATIAETEDFYEIAGGGFVGKRHVVAAGHVEPDYVATAERFLGAPYLWGGKSAAGIDCSGLVQLALQAAGITCPRDTDMQAAELGGDVAIADDLAGLTRGDIVYWPGHVGLMVDAMRMVHASGTAMSATLEPVADVARRSRKGGPIAIAIKRPG